MVVWRLYMLSFLFAPMFVLSSTMVGDKINCLHPNDAPASPTNQDDGPGRKCFEPCPPTQNDDFKLIKKDWLGNGDYNCSYVSEDRHGSCQYSIKSAKLEVELGDPEIHCARCLDVVRECSDDCDDPPCNGCEECFEILHTCQGDD